MSLRILQLFSVGWQAIAFIFITLFLPELLLPAGIIASLIGVSLATASVLRGSSAWAEFSILEMWLIFFALLVSQALTNTLREYLPITLLQCVMILFALEMLTISCKLQQQLSSGSSETTDSMGTESFLRRSAEQAFKQVSRTGMFFASCYLLSIGFLYVGASAALAAPLVADISLYVVVVSVSLALLLLLRED